LVEQQCRVLEQEVLAQGRRLGRRITVEQLKGMAGAIREDAERKVRAGILMGAIAQKHEVKVTDADIEKAYVELAQQSGKNVAKVKAEYREPGQREVLLSLIIEDKVLDIIESKANVKDGPVAVADEKSGAAGDPPAEGDAPETKAAEAAAPPDKGETARAPVGATEKKSKKKKGVEG
jgi:trigger factor